MAPLTRFRADDNHIQLDMAATYYGQRASTPGTLLVTEATFVSPQAAGMDNVPGIWSATQIAAWKRVTSEVHAKGGFIYLQLWALGRRASPASLASTEGGPHIVRAPSAVPLGPAGDGRVVPEEMTEANIQSIIADYAQGARNALEAGFDGVEIHGANGYLIDQFLSEGTNKRTDRWGGSIENRSRFGLEVTKAVIAATGDASKVAIRLSPWTAHEGVGPSDNPIPQFLHFISQYKRLGTAYLHLVESRISGDVSSGIYHTATTQRNDELIEEWSRDNADPTATIILAGGFTPESAVRVVEERYPDKNVCVAFGRYYISTPDLPFRIKTGVQLNEYDRPTFYEKMSERGYIDYAFSEEYLAQQSAQAA